MDLRPLLVPMLVAAVALGAVGARVAFRPVPEVVVAIDAGFIPQPSRWKAGDLHDRACRRAAELGCDVGDLGACATGLAGHDDKLWELRLGTVIAAQNKRHVRDSTVLPCDAGNDLDWDGDGESPPAWRAQTGEALDPVGTRTVR